MIMFLSSFSGIIDSKSRIAIPSSYRSTIKETKEKVYLFKSLKYLCLEIHLASKINSLVKSFDEKDFFSKKNDHFKTAILSDLEEINIDNDGRFTLRDTHQSFSKFNSLVKSFDEKDFFSKKNDHFKAAILSDLEEINIDNDGRFTLRDTHQSFSKLKKEILFIGKGNHFEIWQKDLGEKHKLESRKKFQ